MPNHPSNNALNSTVAIYAYSAVQDVDAGQVARYSAEAVLAPAAINPGDPMQEADTQGIVRTYNTYYVMLGSFYPIKIRDKLTWTDTLGVLHTLFVEGPVDGAARGIYQGITAVERL